LLAFFTALEGELEKVEFFRPPDKRDTMQINLRNIFTRMALTQQDIRTLHGVITAIAEGRKGPARGGLLNGDEAALLRTLLAEHGQMPNEGGPVRGLSRLLRRNPTEGERGFWDAFIRDRRFVGQGFKRQVPVGPHITDVVSFPLRVVIELVPADEVAAAVAMRAERRTWLTGRGYRVLDVAMTEVEADVAKVLDTVAAFIGSLSPSS
jgi:tRNA/rRNA methyltransferase